MGVVCAMHGKDRYKLFGKGRHTGQPSAYRFTSAACELVSRGLCVCTAAVAFLLFRSLNASILYRATRPGCKAQSTLIAMSDSEEEPGDLRDHVISQLNSDPLAAEFLLSLFWSAMSSFKHDTLLRPFPPGFSEPSHDRSHDSSHDQKKIDDLRSVFASLPPVGSLLESRGRQLSQRALKLLLWVTHPRPFSLQSHSVAMFETILSQSSTAGADSAPSRVPQPQLIVELCYSPELEERFQTHVSSHGALYAFHGSQVENFYSIIHNGLLNMFNKTSVFGEGTYLSTELGVCLNWSPSGAFWPKSSLPHTASCVAVCQVVKHPTVMSRCQSGGEPNLQQRVPEQYFVIANDELVRVKYVLVFGRLRERRRRRAGLGSWMLQHKFVLVVALYVLFLLCMGVANSRAFARLYSKYLSHWT